MTQDNTSLNSKTYPNNPTTSTPAWLTPELLAGMLRGIEKEGLRMNPDGFLAQSPHPKALGSALTHPNITTDFSESLLELITDPKNSPKAALAMLRELHVLVNDALENNEIMWPLSMPCMLAKDDSKIPLANYGTSNIGKLKTLYRHGLGLRYGRRMQTIAGLHYNLSFGDGLFKAWQHAIGNTDSLTEFKNAKYLGLIRNFKRLNSMVLYLFGASPSVCPCFLAGKQHDLLSLNGKTLYMPHATSLRMGKFGYQNSVQDNLDIRYNSLPEYVQGLHHAVSQTNVGFSQLGIDDANGNPVQINDHILQIENEYYSPIRPKQIAQSGESPSHALEKRGIAYVEFRAIDLDPYSDIGIRISSACFLEVLALYCLLNESLPLLPDEDAQLARNQALVVNHGRNANLLIETAIGRVGLHGFIASHLQAMQPLAALLDAHAGGNEYRNAVALMQGRATHPEATLSAQLLEDTAQAGSMWYLGHQLAKNHTNLLKNYTLSETKKAYYARLTAESKQQQAHIEAGDNQTFKAFLQQYR